MSGLHVCVVPSNYPNPYLPEKTPFYRDHARLPLLAGHRSGVAGLIPVSLRAVLRRGPRALGLHRFEDSGVPTRLRLYVAPPRWPAMDRWRRGRLMRELSRGYAAEQGAPDLLHAHGTAAAQDALRWHAHSGTPFVVTLHAAEFYAPDARARIEAIRPALATAAARVAVSPGFADHLARLSDLPFEVLPNPVDTEWFRDDRVPGDSDSTSGFTFTFASVGALNAIKNHRLLINAFARAFPDEPGVRLRIAGEGPEREHLRRQIDELGLASRVELAGQCSREEIRSLLQGCDALVHTSRMETFGVVLAEALACGRPVVATRTHGAESVLQSRELGELCEHSEAALAEGMRTVHQRRYDPQQLRDEARRRFGMVAVSRALDALYQRVLARDGAYAEP